jgi:hypothetical protein
MEMKTFYCVVSEFYDNGTVKANMFSREAKVIPANQCKETFKADFYIDWFEDKNEAEKALKEARAA